MGEHARTPEMCQNAPAHYRVGLDSLNKAMNYFNQGNFGRCFAHLLVFLELCPRQKPTYESTFTVALNNFGIELEEKNRIQDLCKVYIQGMNYYPKNVFILNNFSRHLIRLQEPDAAKRYLKLAYELDNKFLATEKHMLIVNLMQMPRWHFKMLNDKTRNSAFRKAIGRACKKDYDTVIDIGAGCGLLSLFAARGPKIKKVYAIECSKSISKIAKRVFEANNVRPDLINLINRDSTQLVDGTVKGNLIVTEVFDAAIFGEHVLDILIHGLQYLVDDDFDIIPRSANLHVAGIRSEQLRRMHRVCFDLPELNLVDTDVIVHADDPYAAENLLDYDDVEYVTDVKPLMTVDFKDIVAMKRLNNKTVQEVKLKVTDSGPIHAFAVWFDLNLDEVVKVSTSPLSAERAKCWEQAVFHLRATETAQKDEELTVNASVLKNKLEVSLVGARASDKKRFPVSSDVVSFLNDQRLVNHIKKLAGYFEGAAERSHIMDFHPFPLFGLLMAKQGANVYCHAKTERDRALIEHVIKANGLNNVGIVVSEQAFVVLERVKPLDLLFAPPISTEGSADECSLGVYPMYAAKLNENGVNLVKGVHVYFEIIESDFIEECNRVDDANVCGLKVRDFFREFEATEHACITLGSLKYRKLSEAKGAGDMMDHVPIGAPRQIEVAVVESGTANAILYWFEFEFFDGSRFDTRESTHYRMAAFLPPTPKNVSAGSSENVIFKRNDCFFSLYLCD